jgi:hypothetical protein
MTYTKNDVRQPVFFPELETPTEIKKTKKKKRIQSIPYDKRTLEELIRYLEPKQRTFFPELEATSPSEIKKQKFLKKLQKMVKKIEREEKAKKEVDRKPSGDSQTV